MCFSGFRRRLIMVRTVKYFVFLVFLCWCGTLHAEDASRLRIDIYDGGLPAREFQTALPDAVVQEYKSDLPDSKQRDELFNSVHGLAAHLHSFDELDKDQLYIRTTILAPDSLFRAYPKIPQEILTELRNKVMVNPHPKSDR